MCNDEGLVNDVTERLTLIQQKKQDEANSNQPNWDTCGYLPNPSKTVYKQQPTDMATPDVPYTILGTGFVENFQVGKFNSSI